MNIYSSHDIISDEEVKNNVFTGVPDVDTQILYQLTMNELKQFIYNKYIYGIISTPGFWKNRLKKRLGLSFDDPELDYKFLNVELDNKNTLIENYWRLNEDIEPGDPKYKQSKSLAKLLADHNLVIFVSRGFYNRMIMEHW